MNRNNLNYLSEDQFSELAANGSAQDDYGITHDYAEGDLYVTEDDTGGTGGLYKHTYRIYYKDGAYAIYTCYRSTEAPLDYSLYSELCNGAAIYPIGSSAVMSGVDTSYSTYEPVTVQATVNPSSSILSFYYKGMSEGNTGLVAFYTINLPRPFSEWQEETTYVKGDVFYVIEKV